jgi:hypothetical protein
MLSVITYISPLVEDTGGGEEGSGEYQQGQKYDLLPLVEDTGKG